MSSPAISPDSDPRIEVLVMMVLDLQMEVEALRRTQLVANVAETESGDYGSAYRETACLTHNAAGMSFGLEKLLALFYPASTSPSSAGNEPRTWRESLMLERLGFSAQEIEEFKVAALQAETFS